MMKNKKLTIAAVVSMIFILGGFLFFWSFRSLQAYQGNFLSFEKSDVSRAFITNGSTGNMTDLEEDDISKLYDDLKRVSLKRVRNEETGGWAYDVVFQTGRENLDIEMISDQVWIISGKRYHVPASDGKRILRDIEQIIGRGERESLQAGKKEGETERKDVSVKKDPSENGFQEYVTQGGPYGSIRIGLLKGWSARAYGVDDKELFSADYGIQFFREGEKKQFIEVGVQKNFGVCGTGLETKEVTLAGDTAWVGYYDGSKLWSYVCFCGKNEEIVANSYAHGKKWWKRYSDEVMEILDSLEFHPEEQEGAIGVYDHASELEDYGLCISARKISPEQATLRFDQYDSEVEAELGFGEDFHVERKENGEWEPVKTLDGVEYGYHDILNRIKKEDRTDYIYQWKWLYGSLKPGEYRISVHVLVSEEGKKMVEKTLYAGFLLYS